VSLESFPIIVIMKQLRRHSWGTFFDYHSGGDVTKVTQPFCFYSDIKSSMYFASLIYNQPVSRDYNNKP